MKFLNNINVNYPFVSLCDDINFIDNLTHSYENYDYEKLIRKNRKNLISIRPGISIKIKKDSIKRDKNNTLLHQFINLNQKKGKKTIFFNNTNKAVENVFMFLSSNLEEFSKYPEYQDFVYLHNNNFDFSDFNKILNQICLNTESIFEIKTKKNNKKLKLPSKYSHEIVYIPKDRRLKYVLRSLSIYKENFKNYSIWERIFWSLFLTIINKEKSFLKKRREYIYIKSIKFFKKSISK